MRICISLQMRRKQQLGSRRHYPEGIKIHNKLPSNTSIVSINDLVTYLGNHCMGTLYVQSTPSMEGGLGVGWPRDPFAEIISLAVGIDAPSCH